MDLQFFYHGERRSSESIVTVVKDEVEVTVTPEEQLMVSSSPIPCVGARVGGVCEEATVGGAGD